MAGPGWSTLRTARRRPPDEALAVGRSAALFAVQAAFGELSALDEELAIATAALHAGTVDKHAATQAAEAASQGDERPFRVRRKPRTRATTPVAPHTLPRLPKRGRFTKRGMPSMTSASSLAVVAATLDQPDPGLIAPGKRRT